MVLIIGMKCTACQIRAGGVVYEQPVMIRTPTGEPMVVTREVYICAACESSYTASISDAYYRGWISWHKWHAMYEAGAEERVRARIAGDFKSFQDDRTFDL